MEYSKVREILKEALQRSRWDQQGGYIQYRNGEWQREMGCVFTAEELPVLFEFAGIVPDEIVSLGTCATCRHAKNGRELGWVQPCLSCRRPKMSNWEEKI